MLAHTCVQGPVWRKGLWGSKFRLPGGRVGACRGWSGRSRCAEVCSQVTERDTLIGQCLHVALSHGRAVHWTPRPGGPTTHPVLPAEAVGPERVQPGPRVLSVPGAGGAAGDHLCSCRLLEDVLSMTECQLGFWESAALKITLG